MQILSAIRNNHVQGSKINLKQAPMQDSNKWASRIKYFADKIKNRCANKRESFVQRHRHEILAWACTQERLIAQPAHRISEVCKTRNWRLITMSVLLLMMLFLPLGAIIIAKAQEQSIGMDFIYVLCASGPVFVFVAYYMLMFAECMDTSYSFWAAACKRVNNTDFAVSSALGAMDKISETYRKMRYAIDNNVGSIIDFWWDISDEQDKNNEWVVELIEILSLGKICNPNIPSLKEVHQEMKYPDEKRAQEYMKQYDDAERAIHDLCLLWKSELNGFKLCNADMLTSEHMSEMGKKIGVDILIDAYVAGVPIEDIVA